MQFDDTEKNAALNVDSSGHSGQSLGEKKLEAADKKWGKK